jgi:sulfoacetaldehyde acetyltransferase
MVIFRNYQWGAEKRNTTLWYDNNFVGTELNRDMSYAKNRRRLRLKGIVVRTRQELTEGLRKAIEDQERGITTFVEVILNQELGEPFRRDAMKKPVPSPASTRTTCGLSRRGEGVPADDGPAACHGPA